MPLFTSSDSMNPSSTDAKYLVFYSSIDKTGKMWCPDCRRVEDVVRKVFGPANAPSALIVYVGQRDDWKKIANNEFRGSPWNVTSIPTILRRNGPRLVDDEIDEEALRTLTKTP